MAFQESIKKIQKLPEGLRKIIFYFIVAISGLIMLSFWLVSSKNNISMVINSAKPIDLPDFSINNPNIDINDTVNALNVVSEENSLGELIEK